MLCRSLALGCLQDSTTVCYYFVPPECPSKLDLVTMSALGEQVALLPVLTMQQGSNEQQAEHATATFEEMIEHMAEYVPGLQGIKLYT